MRPTPIAFAAALALTLLPTPTRADSAMPDTAKKLFSSLSEDHRSRATLPFSSPERLSEVFTGGRRSGVQIKDLPPDQQKLALSLIDSFVSEYGRKKADAVAAQDPADKHLGRYYLLFFGDPSKDARYAWRVAEHHLTLVHVEVDSGNADSFGPILQGANPPDLWDDEEDALIALYGAMTHDERAAATISKDSLAGAGMNPTAGMKVADLGAPAKEKLRAMLDSRLKFFSDPVRQRIQSLIEKKGGLDALRLGFFGLADKRCRDGGKFNFKLAGNGFLCDYENTPRGHIHMVLRVREQ